MPDLTIETMHRCTAHIGDHEVPSSIGDKVYTVTIFPDDRAPWCTCPAQRFKRGEGMTCKHIDKVYDESCCWDQHVHGGEPVYSDADDEFKCPECGAATETFRVAV